MSSYRGRIPHREGGAFDESRIKKASVVIKASAANILVDHIVTDVARNNLSFPEILRKYGGNRQELALALIIIRKQYPSLLKGKEGDGEARENG
jgi:hypothetical protein